MTTPNTPSNAARETELSGKSIADIARDAAILMHENSYFRNGLLTPNAFIDAATAEIRKAIERDRAERNAESTRKLLASDAQNDKLHKSWIGALDVGNRMLMERDALKQQLAEREAELAEAIEWRDRYQRTAHINARDADTATARLAEQSAALDACKGVLLELRPKTMVLRRDRWDGNELVTTGETQRIDAALAQIEALAKGTFSSGGKGAKS